MEEEKRRQARKAAMEQEVKHEDLSSLEGREEEDEIPNEGEEKIRRGVDHG